MGFSVINIYNKSSNGYIDILCKPNCHVIMWILELLCYLAQIYCTNSSHRKFWEMELGKYKFQWQEKVNHNIVKYFTIQIVFILNSAYPYNCWYNDMLFIMATLQYPSRVVIYACYTRILHLHFFLCFVEP